MPFRTSLAKKATEKNSNLFVTFSYNATYKITMRKSISKMIILLIFTSCNSMYISVVNAPMFQNKNELQAETYIATDGFQGRVAFSPIKYVGTQLNAQTFNSKFEYLTPTEKSNKHNLIEGAIGCYYNYKDLISAEYFFGGGYCTVSSPSPASFDDHHDKAFLWGYYYKYYHQFDIGYSISRRSKIIGIAKFSELKYRVPEMLPDKWIGNKINKFNIAEFGFMVNHKLSKRLILTYGFVSILHLSPAEIVTNEKSIGVGVKYTINFDNNK